MFVSMNDPINGSQNLSSAFTYEVVRETWLTKKPHSHAKSVAVISTLIVIFISALNFIDLYNIKSLFSASGQNVFTENNWWRLWSTLFLHSDPAHLFSNMLLFFPLSYFLNGYFGAKMFPCLALIFGGVVNFLSLITYDPQITLIGASGVVYWMGGIWLVLYFFLSRQKNLANRIIRSLGVAILIFMPSGAFEQHISHRTHAIGFLLGLFAGIVYFLIFKKTFRLAEKRETIFDYPNPDEELS